MTQVQVPTRLSECGDTVGIREICSVLGISARQFRHLRAHGWRFPASIAGLSYRWRTVDVQRFLDEQASRLRKVS